MKYFSVYRPRPQGKGCIKWLIRERWKSISDDETLKKKSTFLFMILNENLISQKPINQCGSVREDLCTPGRGERDNVAFYRNTGSF